MYKQSWLHEHFRWWQNQQCSSIDKLASSFFFWGGGGRQGVIVKIMLYANSFPVNTVNKHIPFLFVLWTEGTVSKKDNYCSHYYWCPFWGLYQTYMASKQSGIYVWCQCLGSEVHWLILYSDVCVHIYINFPLHVCSTCMKCLMSCECELFV